VLPKKILKAIKAGNVKRFYKSTIWEHKRLEILRRDNHECQKCKAKGLYSKAKTVHHIKHLKDRPDLALDDNNLISLCNACHNEEHPEKFEKFRENWESANKPDISERW